MNKHLNNNEDEHVGFVAVYSPFGYKVLEKHFIRDEWRTRGEEELQRASRWATAKAKREGSEDFDLRVFNLTCSTLSYWASKPVQRHESEGTHILPSDWHPGVLYALMLHVGSPYILVDSDSRDGSVMSFQCPTMADAEQLVDNLVEKFMLTHHADIDAAGAVIVTSEDGEVCTWPVLPGSKAEGERLLQETKEFVTDLGAQIGRELSAAEALANEIMRAFGEEGENADVRVRCYSLMLALETPLIKFEIDDYSEDFDIYTFHQGEWRHVKRHNREVDVEATS
jgi:hypothetical protein